MVGPEDKSVAVNKEQAWLRHEPPSYLPLQEQRYHGHTIGCNVWLLRIGRFVFVIKINSLQFGFWIAINKSSSVTNMLIFQEFPFAL
jgi:hypothetical protein